MKNKNFKLMIFEKRRMISTLLAIVVTAMFIAGSSVSSYSSVNQELEENAEQLKEGGNIRQTESSDCNCPPEDPLRDLLSSNFYSGKFATGFIPPESDLSHLTGQEIPERFIGTKLPSSFDWRDYGKVTSVKNQKSCPTCYAFAALGCFESKILIDGGATFDLSEDNVKECLFDPPRCDRGGNFYKVSSFLSQGGTVNESDDPYYEGNDPNPNCGHYDFQQTLLDWRIITGNKVPWKKVLKNYIYNEGPVYTSMFADSSEGFNMDYDGEYTFDYKPDHDDINHAVLIVGWSDNLPPVPGETKPADGWIVKNSWGPNFGDNGYFNITYGSANIGMWSSYVDQWSYNDTTAEIMYYDERGWVTHQWGCDTKTGWGLCKFTPTSNTNVTRVEFWTTDITTDVDVYIYDDFDVTTKALSNMMWKSLDHAFSEAGYHGVAVSPPLPVTSGDDVVAVVKFTNRCHKEPVPYDDDSKSKIESKCTYVSPDGSNGSWIDLGVSSYTADVAIRLRYSLNNPPSKPTKPSGPTSGRVRTLYTYSSSTSDPEANQMYYWFDWGDGTDSGWVGPYNSGQTGSASHKWKIWKSYDIKVKSKDIYGVESEWSDPLSVTMPKNKPYFYNFSLLSWIFEKYPNAFPLLRQLLGL